MMLRNLLTPRRFESVRARRRLVTLMYTGWIFMLVFPPLYRGHVSPALDAVLSVLGLGATIAGSLSWCILITLRWLNAIAAPKGLDERLLVRRNETYTLSFRIVAGVCALQAIAWQLHFFFEAPQGFDLTSTFLWGDLFLVCTLPMAIFAWTEPRPLRDEDAG